MRRIVVLTIWVLAFAPIAGAGGIVAPEIDPGGLGMAAAVLAGGYLIIAAHFRRK